LRIHAAEAPCGSLHDSYPESVEVEDVRLAVYASFAGTGRAPEVDRLADRFSVSRQEIEQALRTLAADRHLALGADGSILMAHPFSSVPLGFSVMGTENRSGGLPG